MLEPLKAVKDEWLSEEPDHNLLDYVTDFRYKLYKACEMAQNNLKGAQEKMKTWYDKKARRRVFKAGDKVLVLLPVVGEPLRAKFSGPYKIEKKISDLNYIVCTPDRGKKRRMCHINMLKEYFDREGTNPVVAVQMVNIEGECSEECEDQSVDVTPKGVDTGCTPKLNNTEVLNNIELKVAHLEPSQQQEIIQLLREYDYLFGDNPGRTNLTAHDVDVGHAKPIKQHPYHVSPSKLKQMRKEIKYMIEHKIIEPCQQSEWCSPVVLVPKLDGTQRLCIDHKKQKNKYHQNNTLDLKVQSVFSFHNTDLLGNPISNIVN